MHVDRDFTVTDNIRCALMEAYARGVNAFIQQHQNTLPLEFALLKYKPRPWQPTDSLVIAGYMYQTLTDTWERELDRAKVEERVGADRSKELFAVDAPMDHFVVGDPDVPNDGSQASRADPDDDDDDDDDMPTDSILKAASPSPGGVGIARNVCRDIYFRTLAFRCKTISRRNAKRNSQRPGEQQLGCQRSTHRDLGKASLLATAKQHTHLELSIPPIPGMKFISPRPASTRRVLLCPAHHSSSSATTTISPSGFTGTTAPMYKTSTSKHLKSRSARRIPSEREPGVKAQVFDEAIRVKGQPDEHLRVVVTADTGPVLHQEGDKIYALPDGPRWNPEALATRTTGFPHGQKLARISGEK